MSRLQQATSLRRIRQLNTRGDKVVKFRSMCLLFWLCLVPIPAVAQHNPVSKTSAVRSQPIEQEILRLEELGRQRSLKGEKQWDDLMADGAYLIQGDGSVMLYQKGQNLSSMPLKSFKMSELIVRVYGDTAVVTGLSDIAVETAEKRPFSFQMRFLNVWKKFSGGWKIVVTERTMVRPYTK